MALSLRKRMTAAPPDKVAGYQARLEHCHAERDRRLERLAVEVLTALGERDAMIAATEQRAAAALQAMINDEHLTVSLRRRSGVPEQSAIVKQPSFVN